MARIYRVRKIKYNRMETVNYTLNLLTVTELSYPTEKTPHYFVRTNS